jgi:hypothetical protein
MELLARGCGSHIMRRDAIAGAARRRRILVNLRRDPSRDEDAISTGPLLATAAVVASCGAHSYLPVRTAGPALAPGVAHTEETFEGARGIHLYGQAWRPQSAPPRGALIIVHGLKDHGDRYAELATRLAARGFAVYAADLRGHAHSEGTRVWIDSFDDYLDDLDVYVKRVAAREPGGRPPRPGRSADLPARRAGARRAS